MGNYYFSAKTREALAIDKYGSDYCKYSFLAEAHEKLALTEEGRKFLKKFKLDGEEYVVEDDVPTVRYDMATQKNQLSDFKKYFQVEYDKLEKKDYYAYYCIRCRIKAANIRISCWEDYDCLIQSIASKTKECCILKDFVECFYNEVITIRSANQKARWEKESDKVYEKYKNIFCKIKECEKSISTYIGKSMYDKFNDYIKDSIERYEKICEFIEQYHEELDDLKRQDPYAYNYLYYNCVLSKYCIDCLDCYGISLEGMSIEELEGKTKVK